MPPRVLREKLRVAPSVLQMRERLVPVVGQRVLVRLSEAVLLSVVGVLALAVKVALERTRLLPVEKPIKVEELAVVQQQLPPAVALVERG